MVENSTAKVEAAPPAKGIATEGTTSTQLPQWDFFQWDYCMYEGLVTSGAPPDGEAVVETTKQAKGSVEAPKRSKSFVESAQMAKGTVEAVKRSKSFVEATKQARAYIEPTKV